MSTHKSSHTSKWLARHPGWQVPSKQNAQKKGYFYAYPEDAISSRVMPALSNIVFREIGLDGSEIVKIDLQNSYYDAIAQYGALVVPSGAIDSLGEKIQYKLGVLGMRVANSQDTMIALLLDWKVPAKSDAAKRVLDMLGSVDVVPYREPCKGLPLDERLKMASCKPGLVVPYEDRFREGSGRSLGPWKDLFIKFYMLP